MSYEEALKRWGASKLVNRYDGLSIEDLDIDNIWVRITVDPGFPDAEDSFYRPAAAIIEISGCLINAKELTFTSESMWRSTSNTKEFARNAELETTIEYPDMFEIVREMDKLGN